MATVIACGLPSGNLRRQLRPRLLLHRCPLRRRQSSRMQELLSVEVKNRDSNSVSPTDSIRPLFPAAEQFPCAVSDAGHIVKPRQKEGRGSHSRIMWHRPAFGIKAHNLDSFDDPRERHLR